MRNCISFISVVLIVFYGLSIIIDNVDIMIIKSYFLYGGMVLINILNSIYIIKDNKND